MALLRREIGTLAEVRDERALVIRGSDGSFSSGRDLKEAKDLALEAGLDQQAEWVEAFRALRRLPIPSVAAVEGHAVAGGFTLAMGCDFVLAERGAGFGALEMRNGFPAAVCIPILARLVEPRFGLELAMFGDIATAERLYEVGLVTQLVDGGTMDDAIDTFTDRIVNLSSVAVRETLESWRAAESVPIEQSLTMGLRLNQLLDASGRFSLPNPSFSAKDPANRPERRRKAHGSDSSMWQSTHCRMGPLSSPARFFSSWQPRQRSWNCSSNSGQTSSLVTWQTMQGSVPVSST